MDQKQLGSKVQMLFKVHNKFLPDLSVLAEWTKALTPFVSVFDAVYEDAKVDLEMPSLGDLVASCRREMQRQSSSQTVGRLPEYIDTPGLTTSATMSLMYLHYTQGWTEQEFKGSVFKVTFEKLFPGQLYDFERFREQFPKEQVVAWVENHGK